MVQHRIKNVILDNVQNLRLDLASVMGSMMTGRVREVLRIVIFSHRSCLGWFTEELRLSQCRNIKLIGAMSRANEFTQIYLSAFKSF